MQARTRRQKEVYDYIKYYVEEYGNEPSYQMIARHLRLRSKAGIARHIKALEAQGLISRRRENGSFWLDLHQTESISETVCEIEWLDVPTMENADKDWKKEMIFMPKFLLGDLEANRLRAFRVPNDSMREEHICEGDIALIEKRAYARDGDIVVAVVGGKRAALKYYFRAGANTELRPANDAFQTIKLPAHKISLLGTYRGLVRPIV